MLDFKIDPFKGNAHFKSLGGKDTPSQPRQPATHHQPLPKDESHSIGDRALNVGTSGISHVLSALDTPGQAVRGLLGGNGVGSFKHLVPFSDTMGLTTEKNQTTGRELTNQTGLTDRKDNGWGARGTGLAADIATDPLSYMTCGAKHALTATGKAVQKTEALRGFTGKQMLHGFQATEPALLQAGKTASDVEHLADKGTRIARGSVADTGVQAGQPLASLVRVGIPINRARSQRGHRADGTENRWGG